MMPTTTSNQFAEEAMRQAQREYIQQQYAQSYTISPQQWDRGVTFATWSDVMVEPRAPKRSSDERAWFDQFSAAFGNLLKNGRSSEINMTKVKNSELILLTLWRLHFLTDGKELHMTKELYKKLTKTIVKEFEDRHKINVVIVDVMNYHPLHNIGFWNSGRLELDLKYYFNNSILAKNKWGDMVPFNSHTLGQFVGDPDDEDPESYTTDSAFGVMYE